MTSWLKHQNYSSSFSIEKSCVLQDANHESRVIRCKEQDLFASIQTLIKDGCEIKQLALYIANFFTMIHNYIDKTRQGYALSSILKPTGYFYI